MLVPIIGGIWIASVSELDFTIGALVAAGGANVAAAFRGQENKRVMADPELKSAVGGAGNTYAITTIWATIMLLPSIAISGEFARLSSFQDMWATDGKKGTIGNLQFNTAMSGLTFYLYNEVRARGSELGRLPQPLTRRPSPGIDDRPEEDLGRDALGRQHGEARDHHRRLCYRVRRVDGACQDARLRDRDRRHFPLRHSRRPLPSRKCQEEEGMRAWPRAPVVAERRHTSRTAAGRPGATGRSNYGAFGRAHRVGEGLCLRIMVIMHPGERSVRRDGRGPPPDASTMRAWRWRDCRRVQLQI